MIDVNSKEQVAVFPRWHWVITISACLVVTLVWTASAWDISRSRNLALTDNDRELSSLASAIAEQTARSLQGVDLILRRTEFWYLDPHRAPINQDQARDFLRQRIDGVPQIGAVGISDSSGNVIFDSRMPHGYNINIAGRLYFRNLEHARSDALVIGEPIKSMVDGQPTFTVAIPLRDALGRFKGVLYAVVAVDYFENFFKQIDLTPGTSIELSGFSGGAQTAFVHWSDSTLSGQVRSAAHDVSGFPLTIKVSRDKSVVLAGWRSTTINALIGTGSISAIVALLAFILTKQVGRLENVKQQLESSEHRWRTFFLNAPVGILVLRAHQRYLASNPAFQRMVGYSHFELAEKTAADITHPDDIELTRRRIEELLLNPMEGVKFQKRYLHRDGYVVWVDMSIACVPPAQQSAGGPGEVLMVATVEDVTLRRDIEEERNRLENQLRQAQKLEALGTFAGGIAHDFNNILGAILGYGERALHLLAAGTRERRYLEQVMNAGNRARLLVERILIFSRSGMAARVPVSLQLVVAETVELLKGRLPGTITLDVHLDAEDALVMGDATHMHQVVMNLCSNAIFAMPDGGELTLGLGRQRLDTSLTLTHGMIPRGEYARLTVKDTGVGISPDVLDRIFNPFFTTRRTGEGTGLGLSLVDGIVREYGGGIDLSSQVGKGTCFDVYLPIIDAVRPAAVESNGGLPRGSGQVVLLVDDEEALVRLGEEQLADLGYEPVGFSSSLDAWRELEAHPMRFDAVLTDQTMPGLTGIELAVRVRELRRGLPVILCSGFGSASLESQARDADISEVLKKPLRAADIAVALDRALRKEQSAS